MKMNSLLVAAIVLAALSGVLYWSNHRKPVENAVKVSADTPPKILTLSQDDVTKIDIKKKSGDAVELAKNDAGKWQITEPKLFRADQSEVSSMLSTLSSLSSERLIEEKASNLSDYGLAQPATELTVTEKDNKSQKLLIGDDTPAKNNQTLVPAPGFPAPGGKDPLAPPGARWSWCVVSGWCSASATAVTARACDRCWIPDRKSH